MKCVTYARVSSEKQAQKELSIPAQLQAMRGYALAHRWTILQEFIEPGVSGRTAKRPSLRQLLALCRNEHVDIVLVHKLDRLARSIEDHVAIRTLFRRSQVRLVSVSENLEDSVSGRLVENIMAAIAEFYSATDQPPLAIGPQWSRVLAAVSGACRLHCLSTLSVLEC